MSFDVNKQHSEKLKSIRSLKQNWNGNGADAIPVKLDDTVETLL